MRPGNQTEVTLHLIRHGRTEANLKHIYCGSSDLPLSPEGISELTERKKTTAYPAAEQFFHSGLLRTKETLNLLYHSPPSTSLPDLQEIGFGEFELRSYEELKHIPEYQHWIKDTEENAPPGGESGKEFLNRVQRGLKKALESTEGRAVIVTHGGVISRIMELLIPGQKNFYEWQPPCGGGYTLCFRQGKLHFYREI